MERQGTNRPDLADVAVEYSTGLGFLMGSQILPVKEVPTRTGEFDKVTVAQATAQVGSLKRGRKAAYPEIEHTTTSDTWDCIEYALAEGIDLHQDKPELDRIFDSEAAITGLIVRHLMLEHERRVASAVFNATTFASYTGGVSTEWNNSGNPYNDVMDTKLTLIQNNGGVLDPGYEICLAISEKVKKNVIENTNVKALLAGGTYGPNDFGAVSNARLAAVLGVDQVFSSPAQYAGSDVWDDEYAMLFIRRTDDMLASGVQMGRTFAVNDSENMAPYGVVSFDENNPPVHKIAVWHQTQEKILSVQAGYLLSNITT